MSSAANKDEALTCARIARDALSAAPRPDTARALRFAEKAVRLYSCPETTAVLLQAQAMAAEAEAREAGSSGRGGASSSGGGGTATANGGGSGVRHRPTAATSTNPTPTSTGPAPTQEQITLVATILRASTHYEVLSVPKNADDDSVKRAYRRLALRLHPDKCRAPRAEEAFKAVSRAFSVLSDPDKRAYYDRTGHAAAARAGLASLAQLLPLLLVVFLTLFSSRPEPAYVLSAGGDGAGGTGAYREGLVTGRLEVPFWVRSSADFSRRFPEGSRARMRMDREIEGDYYDKLFVRCQHEQLSKQRASAWGGRAARERAAVMPTPYCDELANLNARLSAGGSGGGRY